MDKNNIKLELFESYINIRQAYTNFYLMFNPDEEEEQNKQEKLDIEHFKELLCQI